jgi:predicted RNA binding protein YcfA (HicA-like mRNA interferase family)
MKNNLMNEIRTTRDAERFLFSYGYEEESKRGGSHRIFKAHNRPVVSLPDHNTGKSILSEGVKRGILKLVLGESYYGK